MLHTKIERIPILVPDFLFSFMLKTVMILTTLKKSRHPRIILAMFVKIFQGVQGEDNVNARTPCTEEYITTS